MGHYCQEVCGEAVQQMIWCSTSKPGKSMDAKDDLLITRKLVPFDASICQLTCGGAISEIVGKTLNGAKMGHLKL